MLLLLQAYASTIVPDVRARCLATVVKLLAVAAPSHLQVVLADLPVSSFVAGLLLGRDVKAQAAALQLAEILMAKLPDIFAACFVKEGVAHALEQLATAAATSTPGGIVGAGGVSDAPVPRRSFSSGFARGELPPPSPPLTRSRRSSRADAVRGNACCLGIAAQQLSMVVHAHTPPTLQQVPCWLIPLQLPSHPSQSTRTYSHVFPLCMPFSLTVV